MNITQITNSVIPVQGVIINYELQTVTFGEPHQIQGLCEYVVTGPITECNPQCPIHIRNHGGGTYRSGGILYNLDCTGIHDGETIVSILPLQETPPGLHLQLTHADPTSPTPLVSAEQFEMPGAMHLPCGLTVIPLEP